LFFTLHNVASWPPAFGFFKRKTLQQNLRETVMKDILILLLAFIACLLGLLLHLSELIISFTVKLFFIAGGRAWDCRHAGIK